MLTADNFVDSVLVEAKAMKADTSGKSKAERLSGIKTNRKQEKEAQRAKESFVKDEEEPDKMPEKSAEAGKPEQTDASSQDLRPKRKMTDLEKLIWGIEDE